MKPPVVRLGVLLCLVLLLAPLPLPSLAQVPMPAADPNPLPGTHFVHVATTDNIVSNWTYLDHPLLNGDDSAIFFVTQNYSPAGESGVRNAHVIGVWYDDSRKVGHL